VECDCTFSQTGIIILTFACSWLLPGNLTAREREEIDFEVIRLPYYSSSVSCSSSLGSYLYFDFSDSYSSYGGYILDSLSHVGMPLPLLAAFKRCTSN
jgi:hypothetical protein